MSSKKAPRRKKHRNSKLGCATCKRRRIKCMENLPACTNCVKHRVRCEYLDYTEHQLAVFRAAKRAHEEQAPQSDLLGSASPRSTSPGKPDRGGRSDRNNLDNNLDNFDADRNDRNDKFDRNIDRNNFDRIKLEPGIDKFDDKAGFDVGFANGGANGFADFVPTQYATQNFDNLLANNDSEIIYPVYVLPETPRAGARPRTSTGAGRPLLCARAGAFLFCARAPPPDGEPGFYAVLASLGPLVHRGAASLAQIRHLYHMWIGFFILRACKHRVMFLCLVNLTTNYLVTNVFRNGAGGVSRAQRHLLAVRLIQHYATVIRSLRLLLNENSDPEMAASLLYILLLMAIYDPEATADSARCFRDGMFSVLSHALHSCEQKGVPPPLLVPVHLNLMKNVSATVRFPPYRAHFLHEYELMLASLGNVLAQIAPEDICDPQTAAYVQKVYGDLRLFAHDAIHTHVPAANSRLHDMRFQHEVLFAMVHRWNVVQPARMLVVRRASDLLEKIVTLFSRLLCKAVYAAAPQMRFFLLRDLDTPLLLDVITSNIEELLFADLDAPQALCILRARYNAILPELKRLAGYAVRLTTFLSARLSLLYRGLVVDDSVRLQAPIDNVLEWRGRVDIESTRNDLCARMRLHEVQIDAFASTYIAPQHYPHFGAPAPHSAPHPHPVDFMTLQPCGLLAHDARPEL